VDAVERSLTDAQDKGTIFFEADIGGTVDEVLRDAVGDAREGAHGAGKDDHGVGGVAAAGYVGSDVGLGVVLEFGAGGTEDFFCQVVAAAYFKFFREDTEGAVGGYEVYFGDAGVGSEGAEDLGGVDAAAGSGDGEGDVAWFWHRMIIADGDERRNGDRRDKG